MGFLFKYARKFAEKKDQESISVGVVGFTNTGKSSLINVLRNKVVLDKQHRLPDKSTERSPPQQCRHIN